MVKKNHKKSQKKTINKIANKKNKIIFSIIGIILILSLGLLYINKDVFNKNVEKNLLENRSFETTDNNNEQVEITKNKNSTIQENNQENDIKNIEDEKIDLEKQLQEEKSQDEKIKEEEDNQNCLELVTGPVVDTDTEEYMIQQIGHAIKNNSVELCEGDYPDVNECRDHFYFITAIKKNDVNVCKNIEELGDLKTICEDVINDQDCSRIQEGDIKMLCKTATSRNNDNCANLEEKGFLNYCNQLPYTIDAVKKSNKDICNQNTKKSYVKDADNNINYWQKLCLSII